MRSRYDEELGQLHVELTKMGSLCEEAIEISSQLLFEDNIEKRQTVQALEDEIDHQERVIENHCMRLILLEQPVASDLKRVSAALKMISDLERIGDQALDIAQLPPFARFSMQTHIDDMAAMCQEMLRTTIRAFVGNELKLAQEAVKMDDIVDDLFMQVKDAAAKIIAEQPALAEDVLNLLMAAKYFERIGDHTVNISECVIRSLNH